MLADDAYKGGIAIGLCIHLNVKGAVSEGFPEHYVGGIQESIHSGQSIRRHVGNHLQRPVRFAAADADRHCGTQPLPAPV